MAVAVAMAVSGGGAVAVAVTGLTKRNFNHIQKRFLNQCLGLALIVVGHQAKRHRWGWSMEIKDQ